MMREYYRLLNCYQKVFIVRYQLFILNMIDMTCTKLYKHALRKNYLNCVILVILHLSSNLNGIHISLIHFLLV